MSNVFVRVCLSLLETIRQTWNSLCTRSRTAREGPDDDDEDDGASSQTQIKQANIVIVNKIHIEDETQHKNPVQAKHFRYERESQRKYNQRGVDLDEINVEDKTQTKTSVHAEQYRNEIKLENPATEVQYENDVVKPNENVQYEKELSGVDLDEINVEDNTQNKTPVHAKQCKNEGKLENTATRVQYDKDAEKLVENVQCEKEPAKTADVVYCREELQNPVEEVFHKKKLDKPAKDEYVYRLLRFNESYSHGLRPKNIYSCTSLERHVERGSRGVESRYISCCKTMYGLQCLGSITNQFSRVREVVRINITKLDRTAVKVIDLTDYNIKRMHISYSSPGWGYAQRFEEVILDPTTHVPRECVERIGVVHYRRFIKDEHIKLS